MKFHRGAELPAGRRRGRLVQRPVHQPVRDRGVGRRDAAGAGAARRAGRVRRAAHGRVTRARGRRAAAARAAAARPLTD